MKDYSDEEFFDNPARGVTSVLNAIFGNKFENSNIPEYILKAAAERGTAVHKYIENWLNWYDYRFKKSDTDEPHLPLEHASYETNFREWLDERISWNIKPLFTEQRIINKKLGIKGIIDCIAVVNDIICLIDWKTSSRLDLWTTECQLQLYYMLLAKGNKEERKLAKQIEELRCLSLTKSGYRWFKFKIDRKLGNALLTLWDKHFKDVAVSHKKKPTLVKEVRL